MTVKLRLARGGSKKRPFYSIVVADERAPRDGRYIEKIGTYNPMLPKDGARVTIDIERAKHWLANGAKATDRVARFLDAEGVLKREARNNPKKAQPGKKAQERLEEAKAKAEEAAEAAKAAEEEAAAAKAAPAEEAPAEEAKSEEAPADDAAEAPKDEPAGEAKSEETVAEDEAPAEKAADEEKAEDK